MQSSILMTPAVGAGVQIIYLSRLRMNQMPNSKQKKLEPTGIKFEAKLIEVTGFDIQIIAHQISDFSAKCILNEECDSHNAFQEGMTYTLHNGTFSEKLTAYLRLVGSDITEFKDVKRLNAAMRDEEITLRFSGV